MPKFLLLFSFLCIALAHGHAQEVSFKDTVAAYNSHRIQVNRTGMKVLGTWGLTNMAVGAVGYFTAIDAEWTSFHAMNFLWGTVNTGIAALALSSARKELKAGLSYKQAYDRYRATKRLYLINIGLDILYIGTGAALNEHGRTGIGEQEIYQGFGKSIAIQGLMLLLFDNVMFAAHQRSNSKWFQLMNEIQFTGYGIGYIHSF